jgi:nitroreductase
MFDKKIDTQENIDELLAKRWSGRAYDANRPISHEHIISLLEAARWAPSCFGDEPWRFIVCDKTRNPDAWDKAYSSLAEGNQGWAVNAPVLILVLANTLFSHNEQANRWAEYDTGAASMSICVQATSLGLMVHQMGGYDANKATELFSIPEQYKSMAMMSVGYQLAQDDISAEVMERESSERQRNPLAEQFFDGEWGKSII